MPLRPTSPRDRAEAALARRMLNLAPAAARRLAGPPVELDGQTLDPRTQLLLKAQAMQGEQPLEAMTPEQARARIRNRVAAVAGPVTEMARVEQHAVAGAEGELPARLYVPFERGGGEAGPLLVFFHGGGWAAGDLDTHDAPCRLLADVAGVRVLSVDYRLAPETPFPGPVDDAVAAFRDVAARPQDFGADPDRIAVGGDSAGGNLAAVVALETAADGPAPAFQLLVYPVTDNSDLERPSHRLFAEGFFLTAAGMAWYRARYFGADEPRLVRDPRASPLLAPDVAAAAPAHVVTAGFDPLRDEGEAYAARLREAGVPVTLRRHPGDIHGFLNVASASRSCRDAAVEMAGVLRRGLRV